jgi:hypothetical protein
MLYSSPFSEAIGKFSIHFYHQKADLRNISLLLEERDEFTSVLKGKLITQHVLPFLYIFE